MAKKLKPIEETVAAETPVYEGSPLDLPASTYPPDDIEAVVEEPTARVTSDDPGNQAGHILAEAGLAESSEPEPDEPPLAPEPKPATVWKPGSCINCGETTTDAVQVIAVDRFRCTRCKHEWTLAEEQAPFRRLARR